MSHKALIVDDEPDIRELLAITLRRMQIEPLLAEDLAQAHSLLEQHTVQFCLTDMNLPDGNGISLVQHIQDTCPHIPVAVLTAYGSIETAITALKAGAFDFVSKPVDLARLRDLINSALRLSQMHNDSDPTQEKLLGRSPAVIQLRSTLLKLARSQAPVYISGESGSGKELAARLIHEQGSRADKPFIAVNCGAIPAELMESEFFGYTKGSFTGAHADKPGLFQAADGGTLFLDEVADLPLHMQVKLLRAIQEKAVRPLGSQKEIPVNVRIVSATHRNLAREVEASRFRQDLFYRINVIQVRVPPLRERSEDIPLLAQTFLQRKSAEWEMATPQLSPNALDALLSYPFPGNVRELENTLERAMTLCDGPTIQPGHLQLPSQIDMPDAPQSSPVTLSDVAASETESSNTASASSAIADAAASRGPYTPGSHSLEDYLLTIEKGAILKALEETRWNRTAAARKLGMTFRSLRYRLKKLGLDDDSDNEGDSPEENS